MRRQRPDVECVRVKGDPSVLADIAMVVMVDPDVAASSPVRIALQATENKAQPALLPGRGHPTLGHAWAKC